MGGSGRRAAGADGPGRVTAPRFRPAAQEDLAPSGTVARIRANLAALTALREIEAAGRPATAEEQQVLARWSGWGAAPEVFDASRTELDWAREVMAGLLSPEEIAAAARNTLNAHYTDAALVREIWEGARRLGFSLAQPDWALVAAFTARSMSAPPASATSERVASVAGLMVGK